MNNRVITGMGVCGAGYPNTAALEHLLREGRSSVTLHNLFPDCHFSAARVGAVLENFDIITDLIKSKISAEVLEKAQSELKSKDLVYQTATSAMLQAWEQANLFTNGYHPDEIAIIVAGQNLHLQQQLQAYETFTRNPDSILPSYAQQFIDTTLMSFLSEFFNIRGMGFDIGAATASGNAAILQAVKLLDDQIKCCVVVGAMSALTHVEIQAFHKSKALGGTNWLESPDKACRPFDQDHNGFIYGQGSGCIIIESAEAAEARQQEALASIAGITMLLDADSSIRPTLAGEIALIRKTLNQAKYSTVDYINAHGSSTILGDTIEAEAIATAFQDKPWVNATKALIGHPLWSAAIIECIVCIIQMRGGFLHGNINLDMPINPNVRWVGKTAIQQTINNAMSLSFAFGGLNTALLLQKT